jgi:hypothetical protein
MRDAHVLDSPTQDVEVDAPVEAGGEVTCAYRAAGSTEISEVPCSAPLVCVPVEGCIASKDIGPGIATCAGVLCDGECFSLSVCDATGG